MGTESLRQWVKQAEVDAGHQPGLTTVEHDELKELRKENKELRRANDILQAAASFMPTPRLCRLPSPGQPSALGPEGRMRAIDSA